MERYEALDLEVILFDVADVVNDKSEDFNGNNPGEDLDI